MNEQLLRDYLKAMGRLIYEPFTMENIQTVGDVVIFTERDTSGYYTEQHMIPLLDILSWVYLKGEGLKDAT